MTRNWILVYLRLFLLIVIKDVFLSLVYFLNKSKNLMDRDWYLDLMRVEMAVGSKKNTGLVKVAISRE